MFLQGRLVQPIHDHGKFERVCVVANRFFHQPSEALREVRDAVLDGLVIVAILGGSALATHLFARAMYNRCPECESLNAKRRTHCRICGAPIA